MTNSWRDDLISRATDIVLFVSLVVVGCGVAVAIVAYVLSVQNAEQLKAEYPTWEATLKALRVDCNRIDGGEMAIIKNTGRRAIIVQCDNKNGKRVAAYTLDWTGVDTSYRVRAFYHSFKFGRN